MKNLLLGILIFIITTIYSQTKPVIHYTTNNGLCYNSVRCITKDHNSNFWIGTDNGISKFYGTNFKNDYIQEGLPSIRIWAITVDKENSIWAGAYDYGIFKIVNDSVVEKHKISETVKPYNTIREIFYSKTHDILLVGSDYGLKVFKDSVFTPVIYGNNWDTTKMTTILKIKEYKNKIYFSVVNGYRGLYSLEIKDNEYIIDTIIKNKHSYGFKIINDTLYTNIGTPVFVTLKDNKIHEVPNNNEKRLVWDVELYNNQLSMACWGGSEHTGGGLASINIKNKQNTKYDIKSAAIWQLYKDTTNNTLWLASGDNGVYVLFDNPFSYFNNIKDQIIDIEKYDNNSALILTKSEVYIFKDNKISSFLSIEDINPILRKKANNNLKDKPLKFMKLKKTNGKLFLSTNIGIISIPDYTEYYPFKNGSIIFDDNNGLFHIPDYAHLRHYPSKSDIKQYNNIPRPAPVDVFEMLKQSNNMYMSSMWNGVYAFTNDTTVYYLNSNNSNIDTYLSDMDTSTTGKLWVSSLYGNLFNIKKDSDSLIIEKTINEKSGLLGRTINWIKFHNKYLFVATDLGLNVIHIDELKKEKIQKLYFFNEYNGFNDNNTIKAVPLNKTTLLIISNDNLISINTNLLNNKSSNDFKINNIYADGYEYNTNDNVNLPYSISNIVINYNMFGIPNGNNIKYRYKLNNDNFTNWYYKNKITFNSLKSGNYSIIIEAKDIAKNAVYNHTVKFNIAPPYWATWWFYLTIAGIIFTLTLLVAQLRFAKIKKRKKELEKIVTIRTNDLKGANEELQQQAEELEVLNNSLHQQNEEIRAQRDEIEQQKTEVETINLEISQSIDYAERLQHSILPEINSLNKYFADNFILYLPKDKVSGDFYWWTEINNKLIITVADCTGHGVPGAFMSLLGGSFLKEIVQKEKITNTGTILNKLRTEIISALKQKGDINDQKDGMDMAIVSIDLNTNIIEYSGANNPLYILSKSKIDNLLPLDDFNSLYEIKPDKMPVAHYVKMKDYKTTKIQLSKGDCVYLFSDGFPDQFGGPNGKKFKYRPFKNMFCSNFENSMDKQKQDLLLTFNNWKGVNLQIDDVTILGFKI